MKKTIQKPTINQGEHILEEIAEKLGISKERVRQLERSAIKKLKHPNLSKKLRHYLSL
jgi:RNA polymerase primary sigma factor